MSKPTKYKDIVEEAEMLFRLSKESFERFYEGHETRESKIALQTIDNFHTIFQSYCKCLEDRDNIQEEPE